jgi:hypothetical protein
MLVKAIVALGWLLQGWLRVDLLGQPWTNLGTLGYVRVGLDRIGQALAGHSGLIILV